MWDCFTQGHVQVGNDPDCLVCELPIVKQSRIGYRVPAPRPVQEPMPRLSDASIDEWGHSGTAPT